VVVRDRDEGPESADLAALIGRRPAWSTCSGGNPQFLARTLRGHAGPGAAHRGPPGGRGAGAGPGLLRRRESRSTDWVPRRPDSKPAHRSPGSAVLPWLRVLPHFDRIAGPWAPDLAAPGPRRGRTPPAPP